MVWRFMDDDIDLPDVLEDECVADLPAAGIGEVMLVYVGPPSKEAGNADLDVLWAICSAVITLVAVFWFGLGEVSEGMAASSIAIMRLKRGDSKRDWIAPGRGQGDMRAHRMRPRG